MGLVRTNAAEKLFHFKPLTHPLQFFYFPLARKQFALPNVNCEQIKTLKLDLRRKTRVTHTLKKKY
jgi:hypothetical protein